MQMLEIEAWSRGIKIYDVMLVRTTKKYGPMSLVEGSPDSTCTITICVSVKVIVSKFVDVNSPQLLRGAATS